MAAEHFNDTRFMLSVSQLAGLPDDAGAEVAFAGRSNAGKSSAINAITEQRGLARTSKTPGRTQLINYFAAGSEARRLVDLPGYGFAKVPERVKRQWSELLDGYFRERRSLRGLILMMDVRRPLTDFDGQMLDWCAAAGLPCHMLLTKADKLSRGAGMNALQQVRRSLAGSESQFSAQLFSAPNRLGVEEAREVLTRWLDDQTAA